MTSLQEPITGVPPLYSQIPAPSPDVVLKGIDAVMYALHLRGDKWSSESQLSNTYGEDGWGPRKLKEMFIPTWITWFLFELWRSDVVEGVKVGEVRKWKLKSL